MHRLALAPHPTTPSSVVQSITVEIAAGESLGLCFRIRGSIDELVLVPAGRHAARDPSAAGGRNGCDRAPLPQAATTARRDGLWRHTCCEAFIADREGPGYREYNFAPTGEWAAYRFDAYRAGMREEPCTAPHIVVRASGDEFVLEANIGAGSRNGPIGLCCVIEERGGRLSYWALAHPAERPDFHHRGGLLLPAEAAA